MIMQAVISYPVEVLCTRTHDCTGCCKTPVDMFLWLSIGTQTHDYAGCDQIPLDVLSQAVIKWSYIRC